MDSLIPGLDANLRSVAVDLLSRVRAAGWTISPITWPTLKSETLEFTANHETSGSSYIVCYESTILDHLQWLLARLERKRSDSSS